MVCHNWFTCSPVPDDILDPDPVLQFDGQLLGLLQISLLERLGQALASLLDARVVDILEVLDFIFGLGVLKQLAGLHHLHEQFWIVQGL